MTPNRHYAELKNSYLFYHIAQKTAAYQKEHPDKRLLRMGIGDVTRPLCPAVIEALHAAVDDQAKSGSFHGYMPECGAPFFRDACTEYVRPDIIVRQDEAHRLLGDKAYLETIYKTGAERASALANKTLRKVYKKIGFVAR